MREIMKPCSGIGRLRGVWNTQRYLKRPAREGTKPGVCPDGDE